MVERWPEKPRVGRSSRPWGTTVPGRIHLRHGRLKDEFGLQDFGGSWISRMGAWPHQDNRGNAANGGMPTYRRLGSSDLRSIQASRSGPPKGGVSGVPGTGRNGWEEPERALPSIREPACPSSERAMEARARRQRDTLHANHSSGASRSGSIPVRARQARAAVQFDRFRSRQARDKWLMSGTRSGRAVK